MKPRVGLIGFGAIGRIVGRGLLEPDRVAGFVGLLVRPGYVAQTRCDVPANVSVVESIDELCNLQPDLIAECAGQEAVVAFTEPVLKRGIDLMVISTGAFANDDFTERMLATARGSGARIVLPAGAIAGLDGLNALRYGGLSEVTYVSTKPPHAWQGTPAEETCDLDSITEPTVVFSGPARMAARLFPKNANLAATVSLAGIGFDRTMIKLIADPAATGNTGVIEAVGAAGTLAVEAAGPAMSDNPKTSESTAYSMLHAIDNRSATLVI